MTVIELMRKLQSQFDQHGDIDVALYDNGTRPKGENEINDYDVELNTDTDAEEKVVLISF